MNNIVILGAGGMAREIAFLIDTINLVSPQWTILGFAEQTRQRVGQKAGKYPIYCGEEDLIHMDIAVAIGIGDPQIIRLVSARLEEHGHLRFPNLIHPGTVGDMERIKLGKGNIVCAGNIFTTDIQIGSFNIINRSCTIGHDVSIGNYCILNPGLNISGGVQIGSECLVGAGATILQYLKLGNRAVVGAGAVVTKDISANTTVVGIPARPVGN